VTNVVAGVTNTNIYTTSIANEFNGNTFMYNSTVSLDYQAGGVWIPYKQYSMGTIFIENNYEPVPYTNSSSTGTNFFTTSALNTNKWAFVNNSYHNLPSEIRWDPRTTRWGLTTPGSQFGGPGNFLTANYPSIQSQRPNSGNGSDDAYSSFYFGNISTDGNVVGSNTTWCYPKRVLGTGNNYWYYFVNSLGRAIDPDGVTRLGMGSTYNSNVLTTNGLPLVTPAAPSSRPIILHRPFRNVGELGYVFSDTPWRNLDFATPQSGCSALLDIFCINENARPDAVVAGKVDLNTRQAPVLQALIAGGCRDELAQPTGTDTPLSAAVTSEAATLASNLVARTTGTASVASPGPLRNLGDLVGRWISGSASSGGVPSSTQPVYDGFSADLSSYYTNSSTTVTNRVQRFLDAPIRALANVGQVGAWNLMIDVVVQTGKYPSSATGANQFIVQGETRYWVHLAIDRLTGKVLDRSIERVDE
jgi:hypothetical protein